MSFQLEETTIAAIHAAYRAGEVTCADLVDCYLARIEAYDKQGPAINSIVTVNARAAEEARALDVAFARSRNFKGPLHGIPVVVKDQVETAGIMTTFGSVIADDYVPEKDATVIANLRAAGAIILAKTTLPDFATSWFAYSSKSGTTKNPYDLARDPGGSSSGTGAAVAANFATVGIGEDTGGSIRVPSSFNSLVGLKVTPGLISRTGMSPLVLFQDSAGPMCRTVSDVAALLEVLVGFDAEDPYTAAAVIAGKVKYTAYLDEAALKGATIGVVRQAFGAANDARGTVGQRSHRTGDRCHKKGRRGDR
jgi:amidase